MKRLLPVLAVMIAAVFASCSTTPKPPAESLTGFYMMTMGGFNEALTVELRRDSTYSMEHQLISCTDISTAFSKEEGLWKMTDGLVLLEPKTQTEGFSSASVFAPAAFHRLLPRTDGKGAYLVHPEFPDRYVLTRGIRPEPDYTQKKK